MLNRFSLATLAILTTLTVSSAQAYEETQQAVGFRITISFSGLKDRLGNRGPRLDFSMVLRQNPSVAAQRFNSRNLNINIASLPLRGDGLERMTLMGVRLAPKRWVFGANGNEEKSERSSNKTLIYGLFGLAIAGGIAIAATSGGDKPDACIAIFPPPEDSR